MIHLPANYIDENHKIIRCNICCVYTVQCTSSFHGAISEESIHNLVISLEIEINFCGIWSGNALPLNVMFFPSVHLCYKGTTPLNYCAVCIVHLLEN